MLEALLQRQIDKLQEIISKLEDRIDELERVVEDHGYDIRQLKRDNDQ